MVIRRGDRHRPGGDEGVKTTLTGEEKRSVDWTGWRHRTVWANAWLEVGLRLRREVRRHSGEATSKLRPEAEEPTCLGAIGRYHY